MKKAVDDKATQERNNEAASRNPHKKKFLEMMGRDFPDIPVEFR